MAQINDKKSLAQQTADELASLILDGNEFHPGDRLPNEMVLSSRFHVSRTTLREAIRTLVVRGLVEVRHGSGTFVAEKLPAPSDYGFQDLKHLKVDASDLYEARLIFEPQVASLAVQRATEEEMAEILRLEAEIEAMYRRGENLSELDRQFHNAIVRSSHNPFLEQIINIINEAINNLFLLIDYTEVQDMVHNDHRYIMNFVRQRDPVGVKCAMKVHILHGIQLFEQPENRDLLV
ncbi:MAG: FadR family transcriptional regulator [Oscillospiraceae bacterium]|nr:FadR family transcriptional regulator [Oscillospiraceae bacterium]MDY4104264.1 FadR/GntR family transcriptional regulator [Oscillospiraceae bacterium]